jgi:hypothetical protein
VSTTPRRKIRYVETFISGQIRVNEDSHAKNEKKPGSVTAVCWESMTWFNVDADPTLGS